MMPWTPCLHYLVLTAAFITFAPLINPTFTGKFAPFCFLNVKIGHFLKLSLICLEGFFCLMVKREYEAPLV